MSMHDRAAQFSPFAALTGHEDAISETARRVDREIELSEEEKEALCRKTDLILENPDSEIERKITMTNGTSVLFNDVLSHDIRSNGEKQKN